MELAKSEALKQAIESFKKLYNVNDDEATQLFVKEYILKDKGKSTNEIFGDWLRDRTK